ncbi:MAG: hypothetical protein N2663_07645 [Chlorobi bacterium]|nr:hypothetical protein [Chlorobiota bacterium]
MLDVLLLYSVILTISYIGVEQWQRHGTLREGALAIALLILAFVIIWALIAPIARIITIVSSQTVFIGPDTLGLLVTVVIHWIFIRLYFFSSHRRTSHTSSEPSHG